MELTDKKIPHTASKSIMKKQTRETEIQQPLLFSAKYMRKEYYCQKT